MPSSPVNDEALRDAVDEFVVTIDELFGLYLDCTAGFKKNAAELERAQREVARVVPPGTKVDELPISFGRGPPTDPANVLLHTTTQGDYRRRNGDGGRNHVRMAQLFLVLVYEYWEHEYRSRIASALRRDSRDALKVPLFGDLRLVRNDILHRRGNISAETMSRLKTMALTPAEGPLELRPDQVEELVRGFKAALDELVLAVTGHDPAHRQIWHIQ